jgi:2-(1,2-epoxy-1,2-dihydrophenyl)acetyl-CoA isomerase
VRIGSRSSTYSFPFLALGTMPEIGATALLPRLVGFGRAMDLCLTAAKIDADEALRIGLITRVAADDALVDEAVALAERMAGFPAVEFKLTKTMLIENAGEFDPNVYLNRESKAFIAAWRAQKAAKAAAGAKP